MDSKNIIDSYLDKTDWRVNENSSVHFSIGALNKYVAEEVQKEYWLNTVFPEHISNAHRSGNIHIHDLGGLTVYCCGYSLKSILLKGIQGISNIPQSKPAKHFSAILSQIANLSTIFQNEIKGAVAFNSVDTLLAPFIKEDKLTYEEVKQELQGFIFQINSNSRMGAEPAFTNMTFDLCPDKNMLKEKVIYNGDFQDYTYKEVQKEMDMFNKAFFELMLEGDAKSRPFPYPIPTYNIYDRFDWDNPNNDLLWEMAGKYGYPYFANFLNSDLNPDDVRSMCCRLNLDLTELRKRNGGLFGSGDSTGSIGVVTINMPRLGLFNKTKQDLFQSLEVAMDIASDSLEIKRAFLQEQILDKGLIPAFKEYVGTLNNHFNTIGVIGLNELCLNFLGKDIRADDSIKLVQEVFEFMRHKLVKLQEKTGNLYNLEATPAEGCCYSLAKKDQKYNKNAHFQGEGDNIYYTNSSHIPVKDIESICQLFEHQNELQHYYTGGTVNHIYIDGPISGILAKQIVKSVCTLYKVPYVSISPLNKICPEHGLQIVKSDTCPICDKKLELYQRVTGYVRPVEHFNIGKKQEFKDRAQLKY